MREQSAILDFCTIARSFLREEHVDREGMDHPAIHPHKAVQKGTFEANKGDTMTDKKVWFITGAGRGMGVDFAKAALAAGHAVVATGRNTDTVAQAVGASDNLLVVKLDITNL